jgi:2-oxoglutarate dehydrogenase E1 component
VVAETLNLQALDGYTVGGSLHLIQNNQVGFTTDPDDSRSTRWASDLAKGFDVPIIHVNADDVAPASRRPARVRVPPGVRPRRADRPDRLPPLRPQRGRRAGLHAAGDGGEDQAEEAGARALRGRAGREGTITQEEADALGQEIWDDLAERHREL